MYFMFHATISAWTQSAYGDSEPSTPTSSGEYHYHLCITAYGLKVSEIMLILSNSVASLSGVWAYI